MNVNMTRLTALIRGTVDRLKQTMPDSVGRELILQRLLDAAQRIDDREGQEEGP